MRLVFRLYIDKGNLMDDTVFWKNGIILQRDTQIASLKHLHSVICNGSIEW